MFRFFIYFSLLVLFRFPFAYCGYPGAGAPLKYISSCVMDFNGDDLRDIVFLVETSRGTELIVLFYKNDNYDAVLVNNNVKNMFLSCHIGNEVKETLAGPGKKVKPKVFKTNGTYIKLTQPESSSIVYFWSKDKFEKVWTAD